MIGARLVVRLGVAIVFIQPAACQISQEIWSPEVMAVWQPNIGDRATLDTASTLIDYHRFVLSKFFAQVATMATARQTLTKSCATSLAVGGQRVCTHISASPTGIHES